MAKTVEKYKVFDLELSGTSQGNPFQDVQLTADFSNGIQKLTVKGFYKDQGKYGIRLRQKVTGLMRHTAATRSWTARQVNFSAHQPQQATMDVCA